MSYAIPQGLEIHQPHRLTAGMPKSGKRVELSMLAYACDLLHSAHAVSHDSRKEAIADLQVRTNQLVIAAVRDSLNEPDLNTALKRKRATEPPAATDGADILAGPELFRK